MRILAKVLILLFLFLRTFDALAAPFAKADLVGRWEYTSFTIIENGKPSGTAHFGPGTMVFTYHENGAWEMEADDPRHTKLNGSYELRDSELIMKKADGSLYQDFNVELQSEGKEMVLRDKRSIVTASKIQTSP